jgi:hypothetical protein
MALPEPSPDSIAKTEFQDVADAHDFADKLPKPLWVSLLRVMRSGG